jgi:hypothetical protein
VAVASWVGSGALPAFTEAGAVYSDGRLYLAPAALASRHLATLVAVGLGFHLENRPSRARDLAEFERERQQRRLDADAKAVEILVRTKGWSEPASVRAVAEWLQGRRRDAEIRGLLDRFPQHRDAATAREPTAGQPTPALVILVPSQAPAASVGGASPASAAGPGAVAEPISPAPQPAAESQITPAPPPAWCTPGHRLRYVYRCP